MRSEYLDVKFEMAEFRDPAALLSNGRTPFVDMQGHTKNQPTMADALLSLQPKFEKSKVIIWSIYHLCIKVGILGDLFSPVMGYLSEVITLKKE